MNICTDHGICNNKTCPHREPHEPDKDCPYICSSHLGSPGARCRPYEPEILAIDPGADRGFRTDAERLAKEQSPGRSTINVDLRTGTEVMVTVPKETLTDVLKALQIGLELAIELRDTKDAVGLQPRMRFAVLQARRSDVLTLDQAVKAVTKELGHPLQVLPGKDNVRLAAEAVVKAFHNAGDPDYTELYSIRDEILALAKELEQ